MQKCGGGPFGLLPCWHSLLVFLTAAIVPEERCNLCQQKWTKEMCYIHTRTSLLGIKKEWNYVICRKMGIAGGNHIKRIKSISKRQITCFFFSFVGPRFLYSCTESYMWIWSNMKWKQKWIFLGQLKGLEKAMRREDSVVCGGKYS